MNTCPIHSQQQQNFGGFDPSLSLFPGLAGGAESLARIGGGAQPMAAQGADPMMNMMLQNQMLMNQTLMQLVQVMMKLMTNGGTSPNAQGAGSSGSSSVAPPSSSDSSAGGSSSSSGSSGATEPIGEGTATGKRLAEIAQAEATNGDSQGGWCYRDVARSLAKIGINVSGGSAYMAADQLAKNPKVKEVKVPQDQLAKLPAGAIVVWDKGNGHEHGHISIATGNGKEASDLMRNQITNYGTSFRVFMPV